MKRPDDAATPRTVDEAAGEVEEDFGAAFEPAVVDVQVDKVFWVGVDPAVDSFWEERSEGVLRGFAKREEGSADFLKEEGELLLVEP